MTAVLSANSLCVSLVTTMILMWSTLLPNPPEDPHLLIGNDVACRIMVSLTKMYELEIGAWTDTWLFDLCSIYSLVVVYVIVPLYIPYIPLDWSINSFWPKGLDYQSKFHWDYVDPTAHWPVFVCISVATIHKESSENWSFNEDNR